MPSQNVLDGLDRLQKKLKELEPAIEHTKLAKEIIAQVATIPEKHEKFIADSKAQIKTYREESTAAIKIGMESVHNRAKEFANELKKIADGSLTEVQRSANVANAVIGNLEKSANDWESNISNTKTSLNKKVEEVEQAFSKWKEGIESLEKKASKLGDYFADIFSKTEEDIEKFVLNLDKTVNDAGKKLDLRQQVLGDIAGKFEKTNAKQEKTIKDITDLNLPFRFEKLDSTVSAVNMAMQNQQAFLSKLETSLREEQKALVKVQTEAQNQLLESQKELAQKAKSQHTQIIILVLVSFVALLLVMLFKK